MTLSPARLATIISEPTWSGYRYALTIRARSRRPDCPDPGRLSRGRFGPVRGPGETGGISARRSTPTISLTDDPMRPEVVPESQLARRGAADAGDAQRDLQGSPRRREADRGPDQGARVRRPARRPAADAADGRRNAGIGSTRQSRARTTSRSAPPRSTGSTSRTAVPASPIPCARVPMVASDDGTFRLARSGSSPRAARGRSRRPTSRRRSRPPRASTARRSSTT